MMPPALREELTAEMSRKQIPGACNTTLRHLRPYVKHRSCMKSCSHQRSGLQSCYACRRHDMVEETRKGANAKRPLWRSQSQFATCDHRLKRPTDICQYAASGNI